MDPRTWAEETYTRIKKHGYAGLSESLYEFWLGGLRGFEPLYDRFTDRGDPIFEREWDTLLVLDACRFDLMMEVADEYDFISDVEPTWSMASTSHLWMDRNFTDEYAEQMSETAYVTGNSWADRIVDPNNFTHVDDVWRYGADESDVVPPRVLTDRAISIGRDLDPDRMIVHYMQPHVPFLSNRDIDDMIGDRELFRETHWDLVRRGELSRERAWEAYRQNLRDVLEDVALLLKNHDAGTVAITADHGNGVGEKNVYSHPNNVPTKELRQVPWITTTAEDTGEYTPEFTPPESDGDEADPDEMLKNLGYKL